MGRLVDYYEVLGVPRWGRSGHGGFPQPGTAQATLTLAACTTQERG